MSDFSYAESDITENHLYVEQVPCSEEEQIACRTTLEKHLAYWQQQLAGAVPMLNFPTDRPRPTVPTFSGAQYDFELHPNLFESLQVFIQSQNTTLFVTLLTALNALLYRYTGAEDIWIGTRTIGQVQKVAKELMSFPENTLVLRTNLTNDPTFQDLLVHVQEVVLGAFAHQDVPFARLMEEQRSERDFNDGLFFQVMFILRNISKDSLETQETSLNLQESSLLSQLDISFDLIETPDGLSGKVVYNADLFEAKTIVRIVQHWQTLLEDGAANSEQCLSKLQLLTTLEQHQLLVEWNATQESYPDDQCVHFLFEEQVARTPHSVAIIFEDQHLTYQELNQQANRLAHYLQTLEIGPEIRVGIYMERSLEMIIGLLGILKAGGAYVPLDPAYPSERIAFMLEDAQISLLLTQKEYLPNLSEYKAFVICLDINHEKLIAQSTTNPDWLMDSTNLAYVIYTSGSTGKPKGVAMPHRSLCNLLVWQLKESTLDAEAKTLQFASLSFDVSFQEIFSTWCSGGTLVMIPENLRRDTVALLQFLKSEAIARLFLPFVALQQLAEVSENYGIVPTNLQEVITAGEQLQINSYIRNFFKKIGMCTLQNQYGPSESHVATAFTLTNVPNYWPTLPPIGRPITNVQIYLLDSHQRPVPIGIPGDLYIGGSCLARGYLNRSELTMERFIPNPFGASLEAHLYKTGDLARYLPDGNIEFLGRVDHQVKIRGFRIELGEVEAILSEYSEICEAVVIARKGEQGENTLAAYLVLNQPPSLSVRELYSFLKEKLPEYMVPSSFAILDTLPLTPSGKVDRRTLSTLTHFINPTDAQIDVASRTPLEEMLTDIWVSMLEVTQVSIHDNFFELGGNSLILIRVRSRLQQLLQIDVPLQVFFEAPTIEDLAIAIEQILIDELEKI